MGSIQQFLHAVEVFSSSTSSNAERKGAEAWIASFQRSDEGWATSLELLGGGRPVEVETFAAQALKTKARLCRSVQGVSHAGLQQDLVALLRKRNDLQPAPLKQVVLALVNVTFPLLSSLPQLIQTLSQTLPMSTCLLVLEMLADEVGTLQPFGPGSMEERVQLVANIKSALRAHGPAVFSWFAHVAASQPKPQPSNAPAAEVVAAVGTQQQTEQDVAAARAADAILSAFAAWTKLGCLEDVGLDDSQALVNLALAHAQDLNSQAFSRSAEVLSEVLDYCPLSWLDAFQAPMLRLAELAIAAAKGGKAAHAEVICKVVAPFAALRIDMAAPSTSSQGSAATSDALLQLALLPHAATSDGSSSSLQGSDDPVAWAALQAWTQMAEGWMDEGVGDYDLFDDAEFYAAGGGGGNASTANPTAAQQQQQQPEGEQAGGARKRSAEASQDSHGNGLPIMMTAAQLLNAQIDAAAAVPQEVRTLYERLYVGLLHNMVMWQQQASGEESVMDTFTPSFTAGLNDCLAAICAILGARRYAALLYMMMADQSGSDETTAPRVAAAAMHAVSAAGGSRLTADPEAMQAVCAVMQRTSSSPLRSHSALVGFCCALAATGKATLTALVSNPATAASAPAFLSDAFSRAIAGVVHEDDSMDVQTPAALAVKGLMSGAQEAGLQVPLSCLQTLVDALQKLYPRDTAAEQALVVALSSAVCAVGGGPEVKQQAEQEAFRQLCQPLHAGLVARNQALDQALRVARGEGSWGSEWSAKLLEGADHDLTNWLRRYGLLLQHALTQSQAAEQQRAAAAQQQQRGAPATRSSGPGTQDEPYSAFTWLSRTFLSDLWPHLASLITRHEVTGEFVQPLCRVLCILLREQPNGVRDAAPGMLEAMAGALFRKGGKFAADPIVTAMAFLGYPSQGQQGQQQGAQHMCEVLQRAASAVLGAARVGELQELKRADSDPDLAEGVLKVATGYLHHTLTAAASATPDAAASTLGSVCKLAAACCTANHRGIATSAAQCISSAVAGARAALSSGNHAPTTRVISQTVLQHGGLLAAGLIGGLLAASPLSRTQKTGAVLTELTGLGVAALKAGLLDPNQVLASAQGFSGSKDGDHQQQVNTALVWSWLRFAVQHFGLEQERGSILESWPSALLEAAAAERTGTREQQVAGRRLKKVVREFAELHSRTA